MFTVSNLCGRANQFVLRSVDASGVTLSFQSYETLIATISYDASGKVEGIVMNQDYAYRHPAYHTKTTARNFNLFLREFTSFSSEKELREAFAKGLMEQNKNYGMFPR